MIEINKEDIPTRCYEKLQVNKIKKQLLSADDWDDISQIKDYCNALLKHAGDHYSNNERSDTINEIIDLLENIKK